MMRSRELLALACFRRGKQASLAELDEFTEQVQDRLIRVTARMDALEEALRAAIADRDRYRAERDHVQELLDNAVAARRAHEQALENLARVKRQNAERFRAWQIEDAERAEREPRSLLN
jgi:hypothetical protein